MHCLYWITYWIAYCIAHCIAYGLFDCFIYCLVYFKASPLPPAPLDAGSCWLVGYLNGCFFIPKIVILETFRQYFRTWGIMFVIMGSRGAPNGHIEGQMSICIDFWIHFGSLLGLTLGTVGWFSVIWDVKVGGSFQVHLFGEQGMEMILDMFKP